MSDEPNMNDDQCPCCGALIGGGCPQSTPDEIYQYRVNHPEDYTEAEIEEARIAAEGEKSIR